MYFMRFHSYCPGDVEDQESWSVSQRLPDYPRELEFPLSHGGHIGYDVCTFGTK